MVASPVLDKQGYRKFGLTMGLVIAGLFGLLLPWIFGHGLPKWPWIVSAVFIIWALVLPQSLAVVYGPWMKFGHVIGTFNTKVILGLVFFTVFTPVSFLLKMLGKDMMKRKIDRSALSYWQDCEKQTKEHMERSY